MEVPNIIVQEEMHILI